MADVKFKLVKRDENGHEWVHEVFSWEISEVRAGDGNKLIVYIHNGRGMSSMTCEQIKKSF